MTKGWEYRSHEHDDWGVVRNAEGHVVCQVRYPQQNDNALAVHRERGTDPYETAARLVSAAPDIHDALEEIVAITDRNHPAWGRAKAALLKAKG